MTREEIMNTLPDMVICMAGAAVTEGVRYHIMAENLRRIEREKERQGLPYNFMMAHTQDDAVRVAAEVLWKVFECCIADCLQAIKGIANHSDGFYGDTKHYFDLYMTALESVCGLPLRIRRSQ